MSRPTFARVPSVEWLLCGFLLFSVLWRGGKSLETTWVLVGVAATLTIADHMRRSQREYGEVQVVALGFLGWTTLSYLFSTTANYGLDEVLRDSALVLLFLWTARHTAGESGARLLHRFVQTVTIGAVLAVLFGFLVYVMQPVNRFVGTFFDFRFHTDYWPNAWAQFLLLAWPMIVLWMRGRSVRLQVAGCMILGTILGTLLLSFSRGALIAFGGQLVLLAIVSGKWAVGRWKAIAAKVAVVAALSIGVFFAANAVRSGFHPVQSVGEKITFTADEGGSSVDERKQFWAQSIQLITERPLFGWGPYSFRFVHQRLQATVLATSDHPHNVFLKLGAERGVPAAILFAILLIVVLWPSVQFIVRKWGSESQQFSNTTIQPFLFFIAVAGVLAHNIIDFNLQFVGIAAPFWMMLGILAGNSGTDCEGKPNLLYKKLVQRAELCIAVLLLTVALREGIFLVTSSLGRHAEVAGEASVALRWYDRSAGEWFSRDMHLSRTLLRTVRGETERAQEAMDVFLRINPEDPRGWRLQGDITRTKGDLAGAVDAYRQAYTTGKWNDLSIALALVEVLHETGDHSETSLQELKPEIDALLGSFVEAIVHNAHFVALSHNAEDAIALCGLLAEVFPDSAPRYEVLAARVDFAMRAERAKVKSRPAGYLW